MLIKNIHPIGFSNKALGSTLDIRIQNHIVAALGSRLEPEPNEAVLEWPEACISPGWTDLGVHACDPGFEHREDLYSAAAAAAAGGYTTIACFPNTQPAIHSKSEVLYVKNRASSLPVRVEVIGALSLECAGKDLAELFDMHHAGAVAFSDGASPVQDAGLLLRALQYTQAFGGLVINTPYHKTIASGGQMHEGPISTSLGLKGIPALAEELMVQRDLSLLEYSGGRLHFHLLSSAKSVEMLRRAKAAGLGVSASVAVANLCFTDKKLEQFDSNWKIKPPLRSQQDAEALLEGVLDGTIDIICSNHTPWDEEAKNLEFPYAEFGMIGLQTCFALCRTHLSEKLPLEVLIDKIALAPRRILGLKQAELKVGAQADFSLFQPDAPWTFEAKHNLSKSKNTPHIGENFKGKVLGVFTGHITNYSSKPND
jgi:dihydroorotase